MVTNVLTRAIGPLAALCVVLVFVLPAVVALWESVRTPIGEEVVLGPRRTTLLVRGLILATVAAFCALLVGGGLACGLSIAQPRWVRPLTIWFALTVLLTPPYLYAYAWGLLLLGGEGFFTGQTLNWMTSYGRAVICLSTWLAPVTGLILYRGWLQAVRPLTPIAVLDTNRLTPRLWHVTLPLLAPYGAVAWLAALILALTEYSIPHLCLVQTWNTEVLAAAQAQPNAGALFRLAWPLVLLVVTAAGGLYVSRPWLRGVMTGSDTETLAVGRLRAGWRVSLSRGAGAIVATGVLLTPLVALWRGIEDWSAFGTVWRTYPREWPTAVLAASVSGAAALLITLGLFQWRIRSRNSRLQGAVVGGLIVLVVLAALMPPVVVGDATKAASVWLEQLGDWTHSFTREWPLLSLVGALRFAAILMLAGLVTGRRIRDRYLPLAQTDGLRAREFTWHVFAPLAWPTLLGGTVIVALLSLGEVAASQLVRAPNVDSLAITLLNMIHFGRNDQIIALGLTVTGFVGFCVVLILVLARLWRGRTPPVLPTTR